MLTRTRLPKDIDRQRQLHHRAKLFRQQPTEAEAFLWNHLKGSQLSSYRIRRQFPIDRYIVDFCCLKRKLIIEIDGPIHQQQKVRDQSREVILKYYGFTIIRFTNDQVLKEIDKTLKQIQTYLDPSIS